MATRQALVLSGGGAKGDFQLGAIRALYDAGLIPSILVGTSVGAINAAKLAEGEDAADPTRGLAGLERIWESLRVDEDMSVPAPWLNDPSLDQDVVAALLGKGEASAIGADAPVPPMPGDWLPSSVSYVLLGSLWLLDDGRKLLKTMQTAMRQSQLFSLDPIRALLRTSLDPARITQWASSGGRLLLGVVSMDSGRLRYVTETGALVERDLTTPAADLDQVSSTCQPLVAQLAVLEAEIQAVQGHDRTAIGERKALRARQNTLLGQLRECSARNPVPAVVDLRAAVMASAAIPVVFGLERLAGEMYGDGGLREVVPIQAAIELGADEVFAVSASPIGLAAGSYRDARIADLGARVLDILLTEVVADDLRPSGGPPVRLIAPDEEVHGIRTIDPGLIQISRDYGYMRASDVLAATTVGNALWTSATRIMRLRVRIWERENATAGQADSRYPGTVALPPDPALEAGTAELKIQLAGLLDERARLGGRMPAGVDRWRAEPELHRWTDAATGTRAAEFVQQSAPFPAASGQTRRVSVTMRNTGTRIWTTLDRIRLGAVNDDTRWGPARVPLPRTVPPGQQVTFEFDVTAPSLPAPYQWRMLQEGVEWFGEPTPPTMLAAPATPVRYGTAFRLRHLMTGRALHSHPHNWAHPGGSGQQQVTCYGGGDYNDEWRVKGADAASPAPRPGGVVRSGDVVRLEHVATRRNLHSHGGFPSPATGQQEVSCFGTDGVGDGNDDWRVEVDGGGEWLAGSRIRLIHTGTDVALHSHVGQSSPAWTFGQQEVTGYAGRDDNDWWSASDFRARDAAFDSQRVPASMVIRETATAVIRMTNTGTATWPAQGLIRLGSQNPQDNLTWGLGRVTLAADAQPGATAAFTFALTAPTSAGRRSCSWQLLEEGIEWFGEVTSAGISVFTGTGPTIVPDVVGKFRGPAADAVRAADLVPGFEPPSGGNAREVISQSPDAGVTVPRGTTVTLRLDPII